MTLYEFHSDLLASVYAGTPITVEPHEMAELFNDIKELYTQAEDFKHAGNDYNDK